MLAFADAPARKMIRILVYPNITYAKALEKDSFVQYLTTVIHQMNMIRGDIWWTILSPRPVVSFPNVTHVEWPVPTHAPAMRVHFDVLRAKDILHPDAEYDLVWSHLPEQTHALYSTCMNLSHHRPAFLGYAHWFDLPDVTAWKGGSLRENLSGILEMSRCYVNTHAQKNLVLSRAAEIYAPAVCTALAQRLTVNAPGVNLAECVSEIRRDTEKVIVFNHRTDPSKDIHGFLRAMRLLREHRQDFTVWVPLWDRGTPAEPWINTTRMDKADYYAQLQACRVGIAPKQTYAGWSIAATDGLMNGCPYLFYDADAYKELHPTAETFRSWGEVLPLLHRYLDDQTHRNAAAEEALRRARMLDHRNGVTSISQDITTLVEGLPQTHTDTTRQIAQYIRARQRVTKHELIRSLGWGRGIAWTPYRRALLSLPEIMETFHHEPTYQWIDPS